MAKFIIETIRNGDASEPTLYQSVTDIIFEEGDEVVYVPETNNGMPVTHVGLGEEYVEGREVWCDWHHAGRGSDYEPAHYKYAYFEISIPTSVKKLVFPKTLRYFSPKGFNNPGNAIIDVDPDNPELGIKNNNLIAKIWLKL